MIHYPIMALGCINTFKSFILQKFILPAIAVFDYEHTQNPKAIHTSSIINIMTPMIFLI